MSPRTIRLPFFEVARLLVAAVLACVMFASVSIADSSSRDPLQMWIGSHAVQLRSIEPEDENFDDLNPLIDAIGSATVVQLGEPSHGAGSSFAAKARLVRFLHERMGFDVLLWEAGMYDVRSAWTMIQGGDQPVAIAQQGLLAIWSATQEARPLVEYARRSQATPRPLQMAGFDLQFMGENSAERFGTDLHTFVGTLHDPTLRRRATYLADKLVAAHARLHRAMQARKKGNTDSPSQETLADRDNGIASSRTELDEAGSQLLELFRAHRPQVEEVRGAFEAAYVEHMVENLHSDGLNAYDLLVNSPSASSALKPVLDVENRRDFVNAQNLRWLINDVYGGRKVIVWAHNAHVMNAYYSADWSKVRVAPEGPSMKPTGVYLAQWFGRNVYTILATTYSGEDGGIGTSAASRIPPAIEGSLESRLHRLELPYVFLDFRSLDARPTHPMREPISMRIPKYEFNTLQDLTLVCDAVLYIDQMRPTTRIAAER